MCVCTARSGALQPHGEMQKGEMCTKSVRERQEKKMLDKSVLVAWVFFGLWCVWFFGWLLVGWFYCVLVCVVVPPSPK